MSSPRHSGAVRLLLGSAGTAALLAAPSVSSAQSAPRPTMSEVYSDIVVRSDLLPDTGPPAGALDNTVDITGVGEMAVRPDQATTGLSVCTGTLINPRTVIFAAHCVNSRASSAYGTNIAGGNTAISFGFQADNRPAVRQWLGLASVAGGTDANPALKNATNTARALYAVEQVWYDPRSLQPPGFTFVQADIAIATLDTPAEDIPTWTLLFSPLTAETHAIINGYGARGSNGTSGANLGVDFRRRIAENMLSFLGSLDDRDSFLFGPDAPLFVQSVYQLDFDDPAGEATYNGTTKFDFDVFNGTALAREGTTAGGDSGGPLIVDQKFNKKVVAGVLSGGTRFHGPQPFSSYGTTSFYQPLFLYWDEIVTNNPYKYVNNIAGDRDWTNPANWVQAMDPNYAVERNGQLVNALPGSLGLDISTNTTKFGSVCFLTDCQDFTQTGPENAGTGAGLVIAGGPGSTNFVPNNVVSNPLAGVVGRYYDVTLNATGRTSVTTSGITIDKLTIAGSVELAVRAGGNLRVLTDFTQTGGSTRVDGLLRTGEALIGAGQLSGTGVFDPTFATVLQAAVLPGGFGSYGTLTVKGDLVLSSAALLQMDINRDNADKLIVQGDAQNPGIVSLGGLLYLVKPSGAAPRAGQTYEIITATGGVQGTFNAVIGQQGVLQPRLTYGANNVIVSLHAGSLKANTSGVNPTAIAFASALDGLRSSGYNSLYGLYGAIDVMETAQLTNTLNGLAPRVAGLAKLEAGNQKTMVLNMVGDRLSTIGTGRSGAGRLQVIGSPETLGLAIGQTSLSGSSASQRSFVNSMAPTGRTAGALPENVSGFISGGYEYGAPSGAGFADRGGQRSTWHIAMGLEMEAADNLTLGTAFGYVNGRSNVTGTEAETRTSQAIAYGSYRLPANMYVAGLASATYTDIGVQRGVSTGVDQFSLSGNTSASSYDLHVEAGANLKLAKGMTLTPRAGLRYSSDSLSGYRERGGETALLVGKLSEQRLEARMGARMSGETKIGRSWSFAPEFSVDRVQRLAGSNGDLTVRFAQASGVPIVLQGFSGDKNWTEMKGGFKLTDGKVSFGGGLQSSLGRDDYRDNRAVVDFAIRF